MRWILRQFIFHLAALLTTVYLIPGFAIGKSLENLCLAIVTLALINVFVKPIIKILFLPLNIITLNFFSVLINIGVIVALTKLVPTVTISPWEFKGFAAFGFVIPKIEFTILYTFIIVSISITTIISFLNWITK